MILRRPKVDLDRCVREQYIRMSTENAPCGALNKQSMMPNLHSARGNHRVPFEKIEHAGHARRRMALQKAAVASRFSLNNKRIVCTDTRRYWRHSASAWVRW